MRFLIIIIPICLVISCKNKVEVTELQYKNDSLTNLYISELRKEIRWQDSSKNAIIKATFYAAYKKGVSTGINHCDASISSLEQIALVDSLNFARINGNIDLLIHYKWVLLLPQGWF